MAVKTERDRYRCFIQLTRAVCLEYFCSAFSTKCGTGGGSSFKTANSGCGLSTTILLYHIRWLDGKPAAHGNQEETLMTRWRNRASFLMKQLCRNCRTRNQTALDLINMQLILQQIHFVTLHASEAAAQRIVIAPVCLCVCGSVTMTTRNCVHWSSPNWVCRWR